eukprot:Anaeramoba_ignava/a483709_22.p1 GENE.a483709_22~~a483709_22.p1  ORF type:complete len:1912 (+),score=612.18 a483709_22:65-5800(+)
MGNQLDSISDWNYLHELEGYTIIETMKSCRLFKTMKMANENTGTVYVKIFPKYPKSPPSYEKYRNHLEIIKSSVESLEISNILPFDKFVETRRAGYLIRPYLFSNMRDRLSTRPFLSNLEKKWITYQLLNSLKDARSIDLNHGDLKPENILITSFMWVYITDLASFKPTFLPHDNPADFSYFFDISGRRTCYIAPERFYTQNENEKHKNNITKIDINHDIFSLGCIIAELFLDGTPLFHLSELLSYKKGEFDPSQKIESITDENVRNLILSAISIDPKNRKKPEEYLQLYKDTLFPSYFKYMYSLMKNLLFLLPDQKIEKIHGMFESISSFIMNKDKENKRKKEDHSEQVIWKKEEEINETIYTNIIKEEQTYLNFLPKTSKQTKKLLKTAKFFSEKSMARNGGNFDRKNKENVEIQAKNTKNTKNKNISLLESCRCHKKMYESTQLLGNKQSLLLALQSTYQIHDQKKKIKASNRNYHEGFLLILNIISTSIRNCYRPQTKIMGLDLLKKISRNVNDQIKTDRIIPYLLSMLNDINARVRATAIQTIIEILESMSEILSSDYQLFPEYIIPALNRMTLDPDLFVRMTYAKIISRLALIAKKFLDFSYKLTEKQKEKRFLKSKQTDRNAQNIQQENEPNIKSENLNENKQENNSTKKPIKMIEVERSFSIDHETYQEYGGTYTEQLDFLRSQFSAQLFKLFDDESQNVKRVLVKNITELGVFFGTEISNDTLLPLLITFLNDKDWQLRNEFFDHILDLLPFLVTKTVKNIILPCVIEFLTDPEEFVVEKTVHLLAVFVILGLLNDLDLQKVSDKAMPLLVHPNIWIKNSAVTLCSSIAKHLGLPKFHLLITPKLEPFLEFPLLDFDETSILSVLKTQVSRQLYERVIEETHRSKGLNLRQMEFEALMIENKQEADQKRSVYLKNAENDELLKLQLEEVQVSDQSHIHPKDSFFRNDSIENLLLQRAYEEQKKILSLKSFILKASQNPQRRREIFGMIGNLRESQPILNEKTNDQKNKKNKNDKSNRNDDEKDEHKFRHILYTLQYLPEIKFDKEQKKLNKKQQKSNNSDTKDSGNLEKNQLNENLTQENQFDIFEKSKNELKSKIASLLDINPEIGQKTPKKIQFLGKRKPNLNQEFKDKMFEIEIPQDVPNYRGFKYEENSFDLQSENHEKPTKSQNAHKKTYSGEEVQINELKRSNTAFAGVTTSYEKDRKFHGKQKQEKSRKELIAKRKAGLPISYPQSPMDSHRLTLQHSPPKHKSRLSAQQEYQNEQYLLSQLSLFGFYSESSTPVKITENQEPIFQIKNYTENLIEKIYSEAEENKKEKSKEEQEQKTEMQENPNNQEKTLELEKEQEKAKEKTNEMSFIENSNFKIANEIRTNFDPNAQYEIGKQGAKIFKKNMPVPYEKLGRIQQKTGKYPPNFFLGQNINTWVPKGLQIAHLSEHTKSVNKIAISPDNLFFATASDDETVKIWLTENLQKNQLTKSAKTYSFQKGKITSLTILPNTHTIISGSSDGTIHLFRVDEIDSYDYKSSRDRKRKKMKNISKNQKISEKRRSSMLTSSISGSISSPVKLSKPSLTLNEQSMQNMAYFPFKIISPHEGSIVDIQNFGGEFGFSFIYLTQSGICHVHDLRCDEEVLKFEMNKEFGVVTALMSEPKSNWSAIGTFGGVIQCFDLRFLIPFQTWTHPSRQPILTLQNYPGTQKKMWIITSSSSANEMSIWDVKNAKCRQVFRVVDSESDTSKSFGEYFKSPSNSNLYKQQNIDTLLLSNEINDYSILNSDIPSVKQKQNNSIRAIYCSNKHSFLLTGGQDSRLRYWDTNKAENSFIISGQDSPKDTKIQYTKKSIEGVEIFSEYLVSKPDVSPLYFIGSNHSHRLNNRRSHKGAITDIQILEYPVPMIISSSQDGVVNVWR